MALAVYISMLMIFASAIGSTINPPSIKGFNVANTKPGGVGLKNESDWDLAFQSIKNLPGNFNAARVYSTTEGSSGSLHLYLPDILPMATKNDIQLMLGVWLGDTDRFNRELQALKDGMQQFPNSTKNIVAISVGNEDLYLNATDAGKIVEQINQVRVVLDELNLDCDQIPSITHTDTWYQWVKPENELLINAVDFVTVNVFPGWEQHVSIDDASESFWSTIETVRNVVANVEADKQVWLGETGWSVNFNFSKSVGSIENLQRYWHDVVCGKGTRNESLFQNMNGFYYVDQDYWDSESFGVLGVNNQPVIDLDCSN